MLSGIEIFNFLFLTTLIRKHYPKRTFAFQRPHRARFGHSDVVFLSIFSTEHQNVPLVNHKQKCLINRIFGIFDRHDGQIILVK